MQPSENGTEKRYHPQSATQRLSNTAGRRPVEVSHADGLRLQFDDGSWVLMRPSRSDPVVRVYSEAPTEGERDRLLDASCGMVRAGA